MIDPDQLPATRTALLDLRRALDEARQGHAILERKREILLRELWGMLGQMRQTDREVRERFARAYRVQREARLVMGMAAMQFAGLAPAAETDYSVGHRSLMGVSLPVVTMRVEPLPFPYSPAGISPVFDEVRVNWIEAGKVLGPWTQMIGSIGRLAAELERTQRRVKALENLVLPKYEVAILRIRAALEEQERASFLRTKRAKQRREGTV